MTVQDDAGNDKGDNKNAWAVTALAIVFAILLADVLVQMGLQLTRKELKAANKAAIAYSLACELESGTASTTELTSCSFLFP